MSKTRLWTLFAVIATLAMGMIAIGCGDDEESDSTSATSGSASTADLGLIEDGTLIVGSDIPYPPFEQGDPPEYDGLRHRSDQRRR